MATDPEGSVTRLIDALGGDEIDAAAAQLWRRYFDQLVRLAYARLKAAPRGVVDEEDVALSAFDSFCRGAVQGRFPRLGDRGDLWRLLVTITARKAADHLRKERCQRRGGGRVVGEAALDAADPEAGRWLEQVVGREPTPAFAAQVVDECRRLLEGLGDEELRTIAAAPDGGLQQRPDRRAARLRPAVRRAQARADPQAVARGRARHERRRPVDPGSLPPTVVDRIDRVCDRFEAAWRAGRRPRIEDYLGEAAGPERSALLRELLLAELECRRRRRRAAGSAGVPGPVPGGRRPGRRGVRRHGGHGPRARPPAAAGRGPGRQRPQPALRHPGGADGLRHPGRPDRRHERLGPGQGQAAGPDPPGPARPDGGRASVAGGAGRQAPGEARRRPRAEPGGGRSVGSVRERLGQIADPDVQASLAAVATDRPPDGSDATRTHVRDRLAAARAAVPHPAAPRPGRAGRGLRRPRRGAAPRGGAEGDPGPLRRRPRQPGPLPAGGGDHRRAGAPRRRPGLRPGHLRRRPAVLRHAVHQGRQPQGGHRALPPGPSPRARPRASAPWRSASCCAGSSTCATRWPTPTAGGCCTAT